MQIVRRALVLAAIAGFAPAVSAQISTVFTYQGRLSHNGAPAQGVQDLEFRLFDGAANGVQVGQTLCADDIAIVDGEFTVSLDFGDQFTAGRTLFLEISSREDSAPGCGAGAPFVPLSPRQQLTIAPMAGFANSARTAESAQSADNCNTFGGQSSTFYRNATNMNAGTLADARLSTNIPRLNSAATFTGLVTMSNPLNVIAGIGSGLTALNASNISTGTLADARLSPNIARLDATQIFTGAVTLANASNIFAGSGAGLIDLNASNLTIGTVPGQALSGQYFNAVNLSNANNVFVGSHSGNGFGITGMNAANFSFGTVSPLRGGTGSSINNANVGDVLKWNGASFNAQPDANTTYSAGAGLTLVGTTFTINPGQITSAMIAAGAITSANIADGVVSAVDLAINSVGSTHLALDAASMLRVSGGAMNVSGGNVGIGIAPDTDRLSVNGTASISGATTITGNVGIGGAPTASKLNVVGAANVSGTMTAAAFAIPADSRSLILSAADFTGTATTVLDDSGFNQTNMHLLTCGSTVLGTFGLAAVHLPHGAVVTGVTIFVIDSSLLSNVNVTLLRRTPTNVDPGGTMAAVSSSGSDSAIRSFTDTTISGATINNDTSMYYVTASFPPGAANYIDNPNLTAVRIDYTTTTPAH